MDEPNYGLEPTTGQPWTRRWSGTIDVAGSRFLRHDAGLPGHYVRTQGGFRSIYDAEGKQVAFGSLSYGPPLWWMALAVHNDNCRHRDQCCQTLHGEVIQLGEDAAGGYWHIGIDEGRKRLVAEYWATPTDKHCSRREIVRPVGINPYNGDLT